MKVLLINPPYQTWTSNVGVGHQVPLGLLMCGGPLLDDGHEVRLLDAEVMRLSLRQICDEVLRFVPDLVLTGHAGSTPAHPTCLALLRAIKAVAPMVRTVYGGVYPTYHAAPILESEAAVDFIVRGEGEATTREMVHTLDALTHVSDYELAAEDELALQDVAGISYRVDGEVIHNADRAPIRALDEFRIGRELIKDWDLYGCFGLGRAAIVQFSRGCPHRCTYCGQHGFWVQWRHRDPVAFVDEIEWLYREHDIRFCTIADENPTTRQDTWKQVLQELARRQLPVKFFATIRATDIVRDEEFLHLYREAGILYVLMGIESTNPEVLQQVRKGSTTRHDYLACQLLKQHGIFSVMGHIVGLEDDSLRGFVHALRQLAAYDGDYLNAMYVTPHSWTQFSRDCAEREVVQADQSRWDYRHQVLGQKHLRPWQLFLLTKCLEAFFHIRPSAVWSLLRERDAFRRQQRWWNLRHTGAVWFMEIYDYVRHTRFEKNPKKLGAIVAAQRQEPQQLVHIELSTKSRSRPKSRPLLER